MSNKPTRKLVCHLGKGKQSALTGLQIHHQREKESQTNPHIDKSRSHLNYDLHNQQPIKFLPAAREKINERVDKKPRKDAVYLVEAEISAGQLYWKDAADPQEQKRFFKESYRFMCNRFSEENVLYSVVHNDETSPHMHFGFVPITKDGRLNAKDMGMNQRAMGQIHKDFFKHMKSRGFRVERGEPMKVKHLEPPKWKEQEVERKKKELADLTRRAETAHQTLGKFAEVAKKGVTSIDALKKEKEDLEKELPLLQQSKIRALNMTALEETAAGFFGLKQERVEVNREKLKELKEQAIQMPRVLGNLNRSNQENALLGGHLQRMGEQMQGMRQELSGLREFAERRKDAPELEKYVESLELKLDLIEEELGIEFDLEPDLDDGDELDDEDQPRKRRRSPKYKLRRRIRRNAARHQNAMRPGRRKEEAREQKRPKPKREHGQIIDKGRF